MAKAGTSAAAAEAIRRIARIYKLEGGLCSLPDDARRSGRQAFARPLWDKLRAWLKLERRLVVDGGTIAKAIDNTLGHWIAVTTSRLQSRRWLDGPETVQLCPPTAILGA